MEKPGIVDGVDVKLKLANVEKEMLRMGVHQFLIDRLKKWAITEFVVTNRDTLTDELVEIRKTKV